MIGVTTFQTFKLERDHSKIKSEDLCDELALVMIPLNRRLRRFVRSISLNFVTIINQFNKICFTI